MPRKRHATTESIFDSEGHPKNPNSICLHFRHEYVKDKKFDETGKRVSIPVKFHGKWGKLRGTVNFFKKFDDGMRVDLLPSAGTLLETWDVAHIWIAEDGSTGVLSPD